MPPKAAVVEGAATSGPVINGQTLSFTETKVVCAIMENLTTKVDANWEKVAESLGQKNAKSAKEAWRLLRKKCNINQDGLPDGATASVPASAKKAAPAAAAENGEAGATPVKIGRGRPPKKMLLTPGAGGDDTNGDALSTPGTAMGSMSTPGHTGLTGLTKNFTMSDGFIEHEQPDTPSKSTTTTSGRKRNAAEAGNPDETPAKKKPVRKPRMTAKQKREAAAAAAAFQAEAKAEAEASIAAAEQAIAAAEEDQQITVAMEGMEEPGSEAAEALALALEVNAAADAKEAAAVDGRADAVASPTEI